MKECWIDLRSANDLTEAVWTEAVHHRVDAIVADDAVVLAHVPAGIRRVLMLGNGPEPTTLDTADIVIMDGPRPELVARFPNVEFGRFLEVTDGATLERACESARTESWTLIDFRDPTKIPLEIVLAAATGSEGRVIIVAADADDAAVVFGVLEHGPDGVLLAPSRLGQVSRLKSMITQSPPVSLVELEVVSATAVGMGERACIDTCSYLRPDEGLLVGSFSKGQILCVSETHPLPYMPTRPFRVNAGAIMSYTLSAGGRTRYLSELTVGSTVLAVDTQGNTREVVVGRTKIESRPLLSVEAVGPDRRRVNVILQHDWHVRVLGPGGQVLNCTELRPGDVLLGHLPDAERHVGHPIDELCHEQ